MYLFIPGRHHLLTNFQFAYLSELCIGNLRDPLLARAEGSQKVEGIIFAVTSANHAETKRNPIPFYLRALQIHEFGKLLPVPVYIYGVNDVGRIENFQSFTIKTINHLSENRFNVCPDNTTVVCSTPVAEGYKEIGYPVLSAELDVQFRYQYSRDLPWLWLEKLVAQDYDESALLSGIHPASLRVWRDYALVSQVNTILNDPLIGSDGDITETRDYGSYVRQMDEIADLKFKDAAPYIKAGRIGDIGCAVGSWIKLASEYGPLFESDFYGIEIARKLFDLCQQRKLNGEFSNPSVFFNMKNAVEGLCFLPNSMDTIHTGSLTHEIESYGSREDLLKFIENRFLELKPEGVWINRDVIGPENPETEVLLFLTKEDGSNGDWKKEFDDNEKLAKYLNSLSTFTRFLRFARDFRKGTEAPINYEIVEDGSESGIKCSLQNAAEYLLTKDYVDNWKSEMKERFTFWSFSDWKRNLIAKGFSIHPDSKAYQNEWIVSNRFKNCARIIEAKTKIELNYPPTNILLIAQKM